MEIRLIYTFLDDEVSPTKNCLVQCNIYKHYMLWPLISTEIFRTWLCDCGILF